MRTDRTDSISVATVHFGMKIGSPNSDNLRMSLRPAIRRGFQITSNVFVLYTFGTNHLYFDTAREARAFARKSHNKMTGGEDEANRAALAYEARALTEATERLLRMFDESSLLPVETLDSSFRWNLVSRPNEKRLLLSVSWK
jgi:hypothetical protein